MNSAPAPLYLLLAVLCGAYLALALADKRTAAARLGYAAVAFLLLLCGRAVLTWDVSRVPTEVLAALSLPRGVTAVAGAWLAVMAAGELARVVLARRPAVEAVGLVALALAGGLFAEPGVGAGVGLGLAAAALAAVAVWDPRRADAPSAAAGAVEPGPARERDADRP